MDEYGRSRAISSIIASLITISMLFFMVNIILPMIQDNYATDSTTNSSNNIESEQSINQSNIEENNIEQEVVPSEITSSMNELLGNMTNIIRKMFSLMLPIMILPLIINMLRLLIGDYSISSSFSSYSNEEFDSFVSQLEKQKGLMINDKLINQAILNSNKKIERTDLDFLRNCIEKKNEWFSYKKEIVEIDPDKKLFSVMILDILNNLPIIMDYFKKNENRCENIQEIYKDTSFKKYISDENNYFEIKGKYYLKELVFYIATNNIIRVKELYRYLTRENERLNIAHSISNFVERELSLNDDLSTTNTLEEVVGKFNGEYNLSINVGFAKNLIFLSRVNNNKKLEKYLIRETSLMDEMKLYRSTYVEDIKI